MNEKTREYSVLLPLDVVQRLQIIAQSYPYYEVQDIMDVLQDAIEHKFLTSNVE